MGSYGGVCSLTCSRQSDILGMSTREVPRQVAVYSCVSLLEMTPFVASNHMNETPLGYSLSLSLHVLLLLPLLLQSPWRLEMVLGNGTYPWVLREAQANSCVTHPSPRGLPFHWMHGMNGLRMPL